jgi:predicted permease
VTDLHQTLGRIALGAAVVLAVMAIGTAVAQGRRSGPWFGVITEWAAVGLWLLVLVNLAAGALLLVGGDRPEDGLHLLYAGVALAVLPLAAALGVRSERGRGPGRARYLWMTGGALVLAVVIVRLLQTG